MGDDKLRISLTRRDMDEMELDSGVLDYTDKKTKRALILLLEKAKAETGFHPRGLKLFVEAYPGEDGGCELFFTAIRKPARMPDGKACAAPVIFEFDGADALIDGLCKTFTRYGHRIYKSSLYQMGGRYRLIVYPLDYSDKLSIYFLSEFSVKLGEGEILAAFTQEHGKELIAENALDVIAQYFS